MPTFILTAGGSAPPIVYAIPFFFVGLWLLVTFIISLASGWGRLAESYRAAQPFSGTVLGWQSASIRGISYNNSLNFGVAPEGLYLATMALFRAFHPPLFIFWSEIEAHPVRMMGFDLVELRFHRVPGIPIRVRAKFASRLVTASEGRFVISSAAR